MQHHDVLRYASGEEARVGDRVREDPTLPVQRVTMVFQAGTEEARGFFCFETGGVLIEPMSMLMRPCDVGWPELGFLGRGDGEVG